MTRKLFDSMDEDSARFYQRIFNTALLNMHAVRRGWFDTFICETEDPTILIRWREAVPQVIMLLRAARDRNE